MSDDPASRDGLRWEIRQSLVERLRIPWEGMGEMANQQRAEAADEIEKLSSQLAEMKKELDSLRRQWCAMVATGNTGKRDPAYCLSPASMVAAANGWDCLNELIDKQPASQRHFFARVGDTIER